MHTLRQSRCAPLAVALLASTALAQAPAAPSPADSALEKAIAADPTEAVLTYFLSVMRGREKDIPGTLSALEQTLAHGDGFLPPDDLFENLQTSRRFRELRRWFARKLPRVVTGTVVATLSDDTCLIPEGVAYDASQVKPTTAAPSLHGLYVLTRTYVARFDADGKITQPGTVRAAQVLRIPWPTNR
jgi:hypothetical protein